MGHRDHVLSLLLYNVGSRVSVITAVKIGDDVVLDAGGARVHLLGKDRKQRSVPLWRPTVKAIRAWLRLNPQFDAASSLLPTRDGQTMTLTSVTFRLALAVQSATGTFPDLAKRRVLPYTIHTTAMHLLQAGIDISVIALWLGHGSPATTHR